MCKDKLWIDIPKHPMNLCVLSTFHTSIKIFSKIKNNFISWKNHDLRMSYAYVSVLYHKIIF